jgi:quinoprotein glucose dehydrogenase
MSLDEKRGIVFVPTGSASPDFYGGTRKGPNLFANSIIALDAATGEYIWHYQVVHHDLWDRDLPANPNLVTITHEGKEVDALAQITKQGYRFVDKDGYPGNKPPWGTMNAVDLNSGKLLWKVPLGEYEELTRRGIPITGTRNYGGPVVTKGGLIFIAATLDEKIRAFDKNTGHIIWEAELPAAGYATPATYMADGKQYLVIACGGGKLGSKSDDTYVAFALPD